MTHSTEQNGSFQDFKDALRAFESGIDPEKYAAGELPDYYIESLVGKENFAAFKAGDLTLQDLQYQSVNWLGFIGYQFGEALLIDLGYYIPPTNEAGQPLYYQPWAWPSTDKNLWEGTWTGKNGVNSLDDFKTAAAQETAIREAFDYNLAIINQQLPSGTTLEDYIGQERTFTDTNGQTVTVELTMSGILASAHLRGAWGTADLLVRGSVTADENGTSILKYMKQFGGFDTPYVEEDGSVANIAPLNPDGTPGPVVTGDVYEFTWHWGAHDIVEGFNPQEDAVDLSGFWYSYGDFALKEVNGSTVIDIAANNQTITLKDVPLSALEGDNFVGVTGTFTTAGVVTPPPAIDPDPAPITPTPEPTPTIPPTETNDLAFTWHWGARDVVNGFDVAHDAIDLSSFWTSFQDFTIGKDAAGNAVIDLIGLNNQTITLNGVAPEQLTEANFVGVAGSYNGEVVAAPSAPSAPTPTTSGDTFAFTFTWNWGSHAEVQHFDIATDKIDLSSFWTNYNAFDVEADAQGNAVIDLTDLNNQTITLIGIAPEQLTEANFIGVAGDWV